MLDINRQDLSTHMVATDGMVKDKELLNVVPLLNDAARLPCAAPPHDERSALLGGPVMLRQIHQATSKAARC